MSRDTLAKLLERHMPTAIYEHGDDIECQCGEDFKYSDQWARHVANAIYPE